MLRKNIYIFESIFMLVQSVSDDLLQKVNTYTHEWKLKW